MKLSPHTLRLFLVTGVPRSGTTAVGAALGLAPGAGVLHEPFSPRAGLRSIPRGFVIPGVDLTESELDACVEQIRRLDPDLRDGIFPNDGLALRLFKRFIGGRTRLSYLACEFNPALRTLVWKDPMACFAAEAVAQRHAVPVLFCLRNPWAVAASFKRMRWGQDFPALAARLPSLDLGLPPIGFDARTASPVQKAAVLWRAVYSLALRWAAQNRQIFLVDMDQVLSDPCAAYAAMYARLRLDFSPATERQILRRHRNSPGPAVPPTGRAHVRRRDLAAANDYWRAILSAEEFEYVDTLAGELWRKAKASAACV